jgi:hypothetical protein
MYADFLINPKKISAGSCCLNQVVSTDNNCVLLISSASSIEKLLDVNSSTSTSSLESLSYSTERIHHLSKHEKISMILFITMHHQLLTHIDIFLIRKRRLIDYNSLHYSKLIVIRAANLPGACQARLDFGTLTWPDPFT